MKKITLLSFLAVFMVSSVAFGKSSAKSAVKAEVKTEVKPEAKAEVKVTRGKNGELTRGRHGHGDKCEDRDRNKDCCKELEKFKCILEGVDSNGDKALCRLEDLLCMVKDLLKLLDYDLGCKVSHIEKDVECVKENTNAILHCALEHIKERLCFLIEIQVAINAKLDLFLDVNFASALEILESDLESNLASEVSALETNLTSQLNAILAAINLIPHG